MRQNVSLLHEKLVCIILHIFLISVTFVFPSLRALFSFSFRYSWTVYETWERKKRIQINFINWRKRVPPGWQQPVKHIDRHCLWNNIVYLETVYIFIFNLRTLAAPTTATSGSACEKKSAIKINLCKEFLIAFNETNEWILSFELFSDGYTSVRIVHSCISFTRSLSLLFSIQDFFLSKFTFHAVWFLKLCIYVPEIALMHTTNTVERVATEHFFLFIPLIAKIEIIMNGKKIWLCQRLRSLFHFVCAHVIFR